MRTVFVFLCSVTIANGAAYAQQAANGLSEQDYIKRVTAAAPQQVVE
jgi:hypothetical protein